jgi:hypothetical protein
MKLFNGQLSIFEKMHSNGEYYKWYEKFVVAAWHNNESITWRWVISWSMHLLKYRGWRNLGFQIQTQPNIYKKTFNTPASEKRLRDDEMI